MHVDYIKSGKQIKINLNTPDVYKVNRIVRDRLPHDRIVGVDTETIKRKGKPYLKYLQLYSDKLEVCVDIEETKLDGMYVLFSNLMETYGETYVKLSHITQRTKLTHTERLNRKDSNNSRDGRRQKITPIVLAFFNMDYDLGRLITNLPIFRRIIAYGSDSVVFDYNKFQVEIVFSCLGVSSPSFQWYVRDIETKKVIRLVGFDSTSYFKSSLKSVCKALESMGVAQKLDQDSTIFYRDWDNTSETPTLQEIEDFIKYATEDAKCHRDVYSAIVEMLVRIDASIIDTKGCIPSSAPSAAARIMMHMSSEDTFLPPPLYCQQLGTTAYKGAISFCSHPGYHSNVSVVDISSAYPHVMTMLPDMVTVLYRPVKRGEYKQDFYKGKWGVLVISGESFDDIYPPLVEYVDGKQKGVIGKFSNFTATIPEISMGVAQGVLRIDKIHDGFYLEGENEKSGLKKFVLHMYNLKSDSAKDSPMYLMSKLLMNSLYGKFIEKRHVFSTIPLVDSEGNHLIVPNIPDETFKEKLKDIWLKYGYPDVEAECSTYCVVHNITPNIIPLSEYLQYDSFESGYYFNAPYASQITGYTRAKLMTAARYLNAYFGDTDSIFIDSSLLETKEQQEAFNNHLNNVGAVTPINGLGAFDTEAKNCNALLVKKKMYYLLTSKDEVKKDGKVIPAGSIKKMAHHGIAGISDTIDNLGNVIRTAPQNRTDIITMLFETRRLTYTTKERPVRIKDGLRRGVEIGEFLKKDIQLTLVDNQFQYVDINGWLHWKEGDK